MNRALEPCDDVAHVTFYSVQAWALSSNFGSAENSWLCIRFVTANLGSAVSCVPGARFHPLRKLDERGDVSITYPVRTVRAQRRNLSLRIRQFVAFRSQATRMNHVGISIPLEQMLFVGWIRLEIRDCESPETTSHCLESVTTGGKRLFSGSRCRLLYSCENSCRPPDRCLHIRDGGEDDNRCSLIFATGLFPDAQLKLYPRVGNSRAIFSVEFLFQKFQPEVKEEQGDSAPSL